MGHRTDLDDSQWAALYELSTVKKGETPFLFGFIEGELDSFSIGMSFILEVLDLIHHTMIVFRIDFYKLLKVFIPVLKKGLSQDTVGT